MKPVMKWAGGKSRLVNAISEAFMEPCRGTYFEPFLGSASVFLGRKARGEIGAAVLSDVNAKLVEVHRVIRDDVSGLLRALDTMPSDDWRDHYYAVREQYNESDFRGTAHAARFLWLNRGGFNGLYRENRKGKYNVPIGSYKTLSFPTADHFRSISQLLQGVELVAMDFEDLLEEAGDSDQVYCDPPYVPLSKTASFTGYSKEAFGHAEQLRLGRCAAAAGARGVRVVISNHDLPIVREELYPARSGYSFMETLKVQRAISRKGTGRKRVDEILAAVGPVRQVA